jgi:hypothetical protein
MRCAGRELARAILASLAFAFAACGGSGERKGDEAPPAANVPPANQAPAIVVDGVGEARPGVAYQYQPIATDPEHDSLTFSAENLPPWASIDSTTGRIAGTPQTSDVGAHEGIVITVADATHRVASNPFSIHVADAGGVASLQWQRPASRVDGAPLDDLAGYRILYGRDPQDLDRSIFIPDPALTSYEFATLESGTWYFAVAGISASGLEGPPTVAASKSI